MGVDVPVPIDVAGSVDSSNVSLLFTATASGTDIGTYTARLVSPDTLTGHIELTAVFGGQSDTLTYVRRP
jgi:hypothetical protein